MGSSSVSSTGTYAASANSHQPRDTTSFGFTYPHILIEGVPVKAWIEHRPWRYGTTDWQLWYERGGRLARGKCQLRLEIESKLRSWLLRECKMPLSTLSYSELGGMSRSLLK